MIYILSTVFVLGILVFVHELGHFIAARLAGIRVDKFSVGFGPKMFGKTVGDTEYRISWIPLGGYCKMAGMIDESLDDSEVTGGPDEFQSKSAPAKLAAVIAGPAMNFVLAFIIYVGLAMFVGVSQQTEDVSIIGQVFLDNPAAEAGIIEGDRITSIDGMPITTWSGLTKLIHSRPGQNILVTWERDSQPFSATIKTLSRASEVDGVATQIGLIGIGPYLETIPVGPIEAISVGNQQMLRFSGDIFSLLQMLFTGRESIKSLGGPLLIAQMAGQSASSGFASLLFFMAFLSLNLAFLNLLPVPILDGGHVVIILVESAIRRPLPLKWKMGILQTGFIMLMALMAFIIYNDVVRLFFGAN
jgi:regulator of sigma E protease